MNYFSCNTRVPLCSEVFELLTGTINDLGGILQTFQGFVEDLQLLTAMSTLIVKHCLKVLYYYYSLVTRIQVLVYLCPHGSYAPGH